MNTVISAEGKLSKCERGFRAHASVAATSAPGEGGHGPSSASTWTLLKMLAIVLSAITVST